jgi:transposase
VSEESRKPRSTASTETAAKRSKRSTTTRGTSKSGPSGGSAALAAPKRSRKPAGAAAVSGDEPRRARRPRAVSTQEIVAPGKAQARAKKLPAPPPPAVVVDEGRERPASTASSEEPVLSLLKRHEIQVLRKAGHSRAEVARLAAVSPRTVQRVDDESKVVHADDACERKERRIGRPSKAEPFRELVTELLTKEPELLSLEVLRRAKLKGYTGSKSALYALVAALRPKPAKPMMRFDGLAGEFSQHDFGEVVVRFVDGSERRVHFFASRLKYSRWVQVSLVPDQKAESLVRALVEHFEAMGGLPLLAVFDRPKTVALKWRSDGSVTEWNPVFGQAVLELGLGVEVCWPYSPQQKGSVENLVGWVKGSFFKQRRFVDEEDLRQQLAEWLVQVNTQTPSRATGVTPEERMKEERPRLRPLRVRPDELALRVPIYVGPTGYVLHDTHLYSMPPEAIGIAGTLYLYRDRVRIVAGRFEATHARLREPGAKSTLPEHRSSMVAAVSGKRGKRYLKRQHLIETGEAALAYLTELVHRRPDAWLADVDRLHALLGEHGAAKMAYAFQRALEAQAFGAEYVAHYLSLVTTTTDGGTEVLQ